MTLDPEGGFDQLMALGRGFQAAKMLMRGGGTGHCSTSWKSPAARWKSRPGSRPNARRRGHLLERPGGVGTRGDKGLDYFKNSELVSRYLVRGSENYRGAIVKHIEHTWERGWEGPEGDGPGGPPLD